MGSSWIQAMKRVALGVSVLALLACSKEPVSAPAASAPAAQVSAAPVSPTTRVIDQLFRAQTVGMPLADIKTIAGSMDSSEPRRYRIHTDGCDISLWSDETDKLVQAVELQIAPSCPLSLESVIVAGDAAKALGNVNALSFGSFEKLMGGGFYADCLSMCGNAADPVLTLYAQGARVHGLMEFMLQAPIVNGPVLEATTAWSEAMTQAESEHYVIDGHFNCEPERFHQVIASAVAAAKPAVFIFGKELELPNEECSGD